MRNSGLSLLLLCLALPASARTWNAKTDWGAAGNGKSDDSRAVQRGFNHMGSGDSVVFPAPGKYFLPSTVHFKTGGIRVKCERGAVLLGPNRGTDIFDGLQSNTAIGGSAATGCIFDGGGVQAYGRGGDGGQTRDQLVTNLVFTYNIFQNMTYAPNNYRSNGAIFVGGGSDHVLIRHNTFSNIMPYDNGYDAAGADYIKQYEPDGDASRAAIWFYGGSNYTIDHNTFLHDYQNIKACEGQQFQAQNILIHHNYSDAHHRMFLEINSGAGCGNPTYNSGIANFQIYDNYVVHAGGPHPGAGSFGFSAPFAQAKQPGASSYTPIPMTGVAWYNNLLKGVVNPNEHVGIGMEVGAEDMDIYNNTVMAQWPCAGCAFGGSIRGSMHDNYACITTPSRYPGAYFTEEHGRNSTSVNIGKNITPGACPRDLLSLAISLSPVRNTSGTLTASATVTTVEYGMQGVVFSVDGHYVSAVMGGGPYALNYGAAALPSGPHTVTATVVDAVGLLARSAPQTVTTTSGAGPSGPIRPNVDPAQQDFDTAGNAADPINGAP